jgi:CRISPR-associated protein (TIGR03986 family)
MFPERGETMKKGQVKRLFTSKRTGARVGFISVIGEPDVYFDEKTVEGPGYDALGANSRVEFEEKETDRGVQATTVRIVERKVPAVTQASRKPSSPTVPKKFSAPYHFVPVDADLHAAGSDLPVWHDRLDPAESWTGQLGFTLTTLTPLLAANEQYEWQSATDEVKAAGSGLLAADKHFDEDKTILEPLLQPVDGDEPGATLIPGSALKGMIRQSLSALVSAPMERAGERTMSYRPNMVVSGPEGVGVVLSASESEGLVILPTGGLNYIAFIEERAAQAVCGSVVDGTEPESGVEKLFGACAGAGDETHAIQGLESLRITGSIKGVREDSKGRKLRNDPKSTADKFSGWTLLRYRFGIDGRGELAGAHSGRSVSGYTHALLQIDLESPTRLSARIEVVDQWRKTLLHLADQDRGHLAGHPKIGQLDKSSKKKISRFLEDFSRSGWKPGDVVFFESHPDDPSRVVSIGHHFRYRWRYRDTVHLTRDEAYSSDVPVQQDTALGKERLRRVLCPPPIERERDDQGRPRQLTGARLLFGYVSAKKYTVSKPTAFEIGADKSDYSQLAGRIACNMAVEQIEGDSPAERFLNSEHGFLVPFKPLGGPKPSAAEHYVTQDRLESRPDDAGMCTWGDTLDDPAAGDLRGRKFYLHQPEAGSDPGCYADGSKGGDTLLNKQAQLGRYVLRTGRRLRFSIRVSNLRDWELGALCFALMPSPRLIQGLALGLGLEQDRGLRRWCEATDDPDQPALALKLGHARPLGLGSIRLEADQVVRLDADGPLGVRRVDHDPAESSLKLVTSFAEHLKTQLSDKELSKWVKSVLLPWLEVHRFAGRTRFDYPRNQKREIFGYHTDLRHKHAGLRKKNSGQSRTAVGLSELSDLPGS